MENARDRTDTLSPALGSYRQRRLALYVLCVGFLMIILDGTIVNVALPSIQGDLGFSQADLAWVVNAYLIPFGGLLLLAGRLGDLAGRRKLFMIGLVVFVSASALCGLAQSQAMLVAARFVQGVGGALTSAVILGMIVTMFPEQREQAKAIGVYAFVASSGAALGLLLGGVLTEAISWHWIFFVNLPIGIVTAVLATRIVPADQGLGLEHGADVPGAVLATSSLMLGVYTIVSAAERGWGSATTLVLSAVSVLLMGGFVLRQHTASTPLMPLRIFRSRAVTGANAAQVLMVAGLFGMFFLGALYLQRVQGYGPVGVGLAFLPVAVLIGGVSLNLADRVILRVGARTALIGGLVSVLAGLLLFTRAPLEATYVTDVLPSVALFGLGAGLAFPALMTLAMSGATPEDAGLASGLVNTTQQVGGALGLAVLATLSTEHTRAQLADGIGNARALVDGYTLAFVIAAAFAALAIALAFVVLPRAGAGVAPGAEVVELGGDESAAIELDRAA